ncbi:MAG TPA: DUF4920 domain-containing protein [Polyangiaceae bacterium]|nr:DUF4920 domain-containing protein [Polyangiaceae bacterium]
MSRAAGCFVFFVLAAGCGRDRDATPAPQAPPPASAAAAPASAAAVMNSAPKGTLALGERITSPLVALADIAKNPAAYEGKTVATSGKVTAVCQEMGCWMQLEDASGQAHVRMHGHTFFVPKTSPGHLARVQATLVKPAGGATDCEEGKAAKLELDATGVEID